MAVGGGGDDPVADGLQRDLGALLLAEQRLLVDLLLGDVGLDPHQPAQPAVVVEQGLGAARDPAPLAIAPAHAVGALEERVAPGEVVTQARLQPREVVRVDDPPPVRRRGRELARGVAHHGLPARRVVDAAGNGIEVPDAVVDGALEEHVELAPPAQVGVHLQALEAAGEARAAELEEQLVVGAPAALGMAVAEHQGPRALPADGKAHEQHRRNAQGGEAGRVDLLAGRGRRAVGEAEQAQVGEAAVEPRQVHERGAGEHLGVEDGVGSGGRQHRLDAGAGPVEAEHGDAVATRGLAQGLEAAPERGGRVGGGEVLQVDGELRRRHVDAAGGPAGVLGKVGDRQVVFHCAPAPVGEPFHRF